MLLEFSLYLDLLAFLAGTLLYGFLCRELLRRPDVLPGNWPLRSTVVCLLVYFAATLVVHQAFLLLAARHTWSFGRALSLSLDVFRAIAWLMVFPLLAHTLERVTALEFPKRGAWIPRALAIAAYLPLLLFVRPLLEFAGASAPRLSQATALIFPQVVLHACVGLAISMVICEILIHRMISPRQRAFMRAFQVGLGLLMGALGWSLRGDPWAVGAIGAERALRSVFLSGLLVPGFLFAFFVRRYNLLRLSLSFRTVRHFLIAMAAVAALMTLGPALGLEDLQPLRRPIAWGLLIALVASGLYAPLVDRALRRSKTLRNLLGKGVTSRRLDELMDSLQASTLPEADLLNHGAQQLSRWLGTEASFLPPPEEEPALASLWSWFEMSGAAMVSRLDPPYGGLARLLGRQRLHAVFSLVVDGKAEALLGLPLSTAGGGYADGELEAVRLALRQLAGTVAQQRLAEVHLAEERRRGEQERLSMLGLISASLAHEIKNPLSSIKALAQALREDFGRAPGEASGDVAEAVVDLDVIVEQIDRLDLTAKEILGLARPTTRNVTDLPRLVSGTLYVLRAEARRRAVELVGEAVDDVGEVSGSEAAWQTVVFNLVLNALEHTEAAGTVTVALNSRGDQVLFKVANPCPPLTEEEISALFEPFESTGGTGLGLALVARRAEELGARISAVHREGQLQFLISVVAERDTNEQGLAEEELPEEEMRS
ncbi:MAG: HAMP domain-containing histidine kinase [Deltaproteobacteria bacterium]|nr:HAMP domain-containing histidine kinase [Deltaproteobacteria bacterium]